MNITKFQFLLATPLELKRRIAIKIHRLYDDSILIVLIIAKKFKGKNI